MYKYAMSILCIRICPQMWLSTNFENSSNVEFECACNANHPVLTSREWNEKSPMRDDELDNWMQFTLKISIWFKCCNCIYKMPNIELAKWPIIKLQEYCFLRQFHQINRHNFIICLNGIFLGRTFNETFCMFLFWIFHVFFLKPKRYDIRTKTA